MKTETDTSRDWQNQQFSYRDTPKKGPKGYVVVILIVLLILAFGSKLWVDKELPKYESRLSNDLIKPEMSIKANEGKELAILWMAKHYPDMQTLGKLENLIEQGNTEAMMIKAQYYYYLDKPLSISLINKAAQQGHPDAIRYLSDKKTDDITFTEFFKYMFKGELNE
ncbi:hypothetical protein ACWBQ1_07265 [Providencia rettgeri]